MMHCKMPPTAFSVRQLLTGLVLFLLAQSALAAGCQRAFRMGVSPVWIKAEQDEMRWLQRVFEQANCQLQLSDSGEATYTRMLHDLLQGEKDVVLGASYTAERAKYLYFSPIYTVDQTILLGRINQFDRWRDKNLTQLIADSANVLLPKHGWYGDEFEQFRLRYEQHKQVFYYRHDKDALPDFFRSSADVVLTTTRVLNSLSDQNWRSELMVLTKPIYEDNLHIIFSKRSVLHDDVLHINKTINEMLAKGDTVENFIRR